MSLERCTCSQTQLCRGSILCGNCARPVDSLDLVQMLSRTADEAAAASGRPDHVPIDLLPDGGYRLIDHETLASAPSLFAAILPPSDVLFETLGRGVAGGVISWVVGQLITAIRRIQKERQDAQEVCLAVLGKYFALRNAPSLTMLATRIPLAKILDHVIAQHTNAGISAPEVLAVSEGASDVFAELAADNPTNTLLRATLHLIRSKIKASIGCLWRSARRLEV